MKFNLTRLFVVLFIIVLGWAAYEARAENAANGFSKVSNPPGLRISLGYTVANSTLPFGSLSYEHNNIEYDATIIGEGNTQRGEQSQVYIFSASHLVRPPWYFLGAQNYYRIGVSHQNGSPLVGHTNFRLGAGLEWKVMQVEYIHYSSAGIFKPNTGIDGIQLKFKVPL